MPAVLVMMLSVCSAQRECYVYHGPQNTLSPRPTQTTPQHATAALFMDEQRVEDRIRKSAMTSLFGDAHENR